MKTFKAQLWRSLPALAIASVIAVVLAGFFIWLLDRKLLAGGASLFWVGLFGASCALAGALVFGERQEATVQRLVAEQELLRLEKQRSAWLATVQAADKAMRELADTYRNTAEDRQHIHAAYDKDTFAAVLGALSNIPVYELNGAEAAIALTGLKQTMRDAQYMIDFYALWQDAAGGDPAPTRPFRHIDLRPCKSSAQSHCRTLAQALRA